MNGLVLEYVLRKLTNVFVDFLLAKQAKDRGLVGTIAPVGRRQSKLAANVPKWFKQLSMNEPFDVTKVLFGQMAKAESSTDDLRFKAQAALLEVLVEEGLAMDIASYSDRIG